MAERSEVGAITGKIIGFAVTAQAIRLEYDCITKAKFPEFIFHILENKNLLQKLCQLFLLFDKIHSSIHLMSTEKPLI